MKIIVAQRHHENLVGIKNSVARINKKRAEEITFTSDPDSVVELVRGKQPALVISGQLFGVGFKEGTDLAVEVKEVNPKTLFFIYSVMPETNESIDGLIPKEDGTALTDQHLILARVLTCKKSKMTILNLKSLFPEINFC